jgi:hypothetical protein
VTPGTGVYDSRSVSSTGELHVGLRRFDARLCSQRGEIGARNLAADLVLSAFPFCLCLRDSRA